MKNAISVAFDGACRRAIEYPPGHSADVTPFPRPFRALAPQQAPQQASESTLRMRAAIEKLEASLQRQRAAIAVWRSSIAEARTSVQALDRSMSLYQAQLAAIDLSPLKQNSLQLAAIMDRATDLRG